MEQYYYILVYSSLLFFIPLCVNAIKYNGGVYNSIFLFYNFVILVLSCLNWNISTRIKIIKLIDKFFVVTGFLIFMHFTYKTTNIPELDFTWKQIISIGLLIQILIYYTISKICREYLSPYKVIFHSIMHLNAMVLMCIGAQ